MSTPATTSFHWSKSLRFRVFAIALGGTLLFALLISGIFVYLFWNQAQQALVADGTALGKILAQQLVAPMDFAQVLEQKGESDDGNALLSSLKPRQDVRYAVVITAKKDRFAHYGKTPRAIERAARAKKTQWRVRTDPGIIHLRTPVVKDSRVLGHLYLGISTARTAQQARTFIGWALLASLLASFAFVGLLFWLINKTAVQPVSTMTRVLQRVADGDVRPLDDVSIGTDTAEIVQMFDALCLMTQAMRDNMAALSQVAKDLGKTADLVLEHSASLSASANQHAAAMNETTVTIEEVEKTGHVTATNAQNIQSLAEQTQSMADTGLRAVGATRGHLLGIQDQVERIVADSRKLYGELEEADRIIASVANVTQQSHTLSINASIEAVKAGKAGRGFAVVANRIRDLSQQSKEATDQVRRTLTSVREAIGQIVLSNEQGLSSARDGVNSMSETAEIIANWRQAQEKMAQAARTIAHNTLQQATGLEQTARAMNEINKASQNTVTVVETLHQTGKVLQEHAVAMRALVDLFILE